MKLTAREMVLLQELCEAGEVLTTIPSTDIGIVATLIERGLARHLPHLASWYGPTAAGRALLAEARDED